MLNGKLNENLHGLDKEYHERIEQIVGQMKARAGITKELKDTEQMK